MRHKRWMVETSAMCIELLLAAAINDLDIINLRLRKASSAESDQKDPSEASNLHQFFALDLIPPHLMQSIFKI